jgi:acyl carrier protein
MNTIASILAHLRPEIKFEESNHYINDGLLDSFDIMVLVSELDKAYSISINGIDIIPENFKSQAAIVMLLKSYGVNE